MPIYKSMVLVLIGTELGKRDTCVRKKKESHIVGGAGLKGYKQASAKMMQPDCVTAVNMCSAHISLCLLVVNHRIRFLHISKGGSL